MKIRHLESADFEFVSAVVDEWWGGRSVAGLLPRLFFEHFRPTSFALEEDGALQGFLVGFRSQSFPTVAYIHFVGVSPPLRGRGYGRMLYERFCEVADGLGCDEVRCITSPINTGSVAFHQRMGFEILPGDGEIGGISVSLNHAGAGQHRVLFRKKIA